MSIKSKLSELLVTYVNQELKLMDYHKHSDFIKSLNKYPLSSIINIEAEYMREKRMHMNIKPAEEPNQWIVRLFDIENNRLDAYFDFMCYEPKEFLNVFEVKLNGILDSGVRIIGTVNSKINSYDVIWNIFDDSVWIKNKGHNSGWQKVAVDVSSKDEAYDIVYKFIKSQPDLY